MPAQTPRILRLCVLSLALFARLALGDSGVQPDLSQVGAASFARPYVVDAREVKAPRPLWAGGELFSERPLRPNGLAKVDQAGFPTFDEQTQAWYASADGALVRVNRDGTLPVMVDDVQGLDLDVRAARGVAVSREGGEQIVLHVWRGGEHRKKVLLTGEAFFNPRLSPDGSRVLVAQSRAGGGHMWLVSTSGPEGSGEALDLGQGYDATWHPDGERIVFVRIEHDGLSVTASTVFVLDLATRRATVLMRTEGALSALAPAVSPDGKLLAWATARGGVVLIAPFEPVDGKAGGR